MLDRSACLIDAGTIELRFTVDLPGAGRRILGHRAAALVCDRLPTMVAAATLASELDMEALERHAAVVEDQVALRAALPAASRERTYASNPPARSR